jgi:hypothetical protein
MADTGFLNFATFANDTSVGTVAWTGASDAQTSNDVRAQAALSASTDFAVEDNSVRLVLGGTIQGDDKASATNWNLDTDTTQTRGGAADKWGLTPTYQQVNASDFGVVISAERDGNSTPESNYLKCTNANPGLRSSRIDGIEVRYECRYINGLRGGASFTPGTMVMTPAGSLPIENIKSGDEIISFDEKTLKLRKDRVTKIHTRFSKRVFRVIANGRAVMATENHPFMTPQGFKKVLQLKPGDQVYWGKEMQLFEIEEISHIPQDVPVHNLTVAGNPTFFADGFAVHNILISGSTTAEIDHVQVKIYYTPISLIFPSKMRRNILIRR